MSIYGRAIFTFGCIRLLHTGTESRLAVVNKANEIEMYTNEMTRVAAGTANR